MGNVTQDVSVKGFAIGITPMLSMVRRLVELGRDWTLHLAVRTRGQAAFVQQLTELAGDQPLRGTHRGVAP